MTNMAAASSFLADPWLDHARTKKKHLLRLTNPQARDEEQQRM
jgi:hypothetical protein